jgi:hypothetical protein
VQEVPEALQRQGWSASPWYLEQPHRHPALFAVEKRFGPADALIVAVHQEGDEFVVWSILQDEGMLRYGQVKGDRSSLQKALRLAQRVCEREDEEAENPM